MTKVEIMNKMTRTVGRFGLQIKKHSPEILIVTGVVGAVTSAVMACKATLKVNEVLEEPKQDIATIHESLEKGCTPAGIAYTEEDHKKDLALVYVQSGLKLAKLYGPSLLLGAASIGCILASNNIIHKRNAALAAAYTAVDSSFKEYRGRVIERFGKELDRELKYNIKTEEVDEVVVDENGKETVVKTTVETAQPGYSGYSIVFDDGNTGWDRDPELTKFFLVQQQNYANDRLKARGHLFLNEVYDMLGAPRTKAGAQVGWIYDEKNPIGDNYVDFGMFDIHKPKACDFINGREKVIILDFNVDGVILDHI